MPQERPQIAGVILRRLKKCMPLQVDPTVLYSLGRPYDSRITKEDLKLATPYNTYQRYGLPPTPIDMPSRASIHAALHPAAGNALYYVARGDGSHVFSVTYQQHRKDVDRYILDDQNSKPIVVSPALIHILLPWYCQTKIPLLPCEIWYGK